MLEIKTFFGGKVLTQDDILSNYRLKRARIRKHNHRGAAPD
jgi:hypothetical protein